jgi:hypothetical protein
MQRNLTFKLDFTPSGKFQKTSHGFIKTYARVTRAGIFDYHDDATGKNVRELRPPEEVFSEDSLRSLEFSPLTWQHPDRMVTVDNSKLFEVGTIGEKIIRDGDFVGANILIKDKSCIDYVERVKKNGGSVELSCGYGCRHDQTSGEHEKEGHFDIIQRDIKYNHVSIVDKGRAGPEVKLTLDKKNKEVKTVAKFRKDSIKTKHFNMDSVEFQVDEGSVTPLAHMSGKLDEAVQVITQLDSDIERLTKEKDVLQGKFDQLENDSKDMKTKLNEAINIPTGKLDILAAERRDVLDIAKKYEVKSEGITNDELKKQIVTKVCTDANLEGKSQEYINARFDMISEGTKNNSNIGEFNKNIQHVREDANAGIGKSAREKAMEKRNKINKGDE